MTEPPHLLSWISDVTTILAFFALPGIPLYKWISPKVKNWFGKTSQGRKKKRLAELHHELAGIERVEKYPILGVLIVLRYLLFALSWLALPNLIEGLLNALIPKLATPITTTDTIHMYAWWLFYACIWNGFREVDYAIDPPVYKKRILDSIKELQESSEQQNA